jgi:hypothetical protein
MIQTACKSHRSMQVKFSTSGNARVLDCYTNRPWNHNGEEVHDKVLWKRLGIEKQISTCLRGHGHKQRIIEAATFPIFARVQPFIQRTHAFRAHEVFLQQSSTFEL